MKLMDSTLEDHKGTFLMEWIRDILKGLNFIHSKGVLHNDIHPGNIFIHRGTAKIGDFGCATRSVRHHYQTDLQDLGDLILMWVKEPSEQQKTLAELLKTDNVSYIDISSHLDKISYGVVITFSNIPETRCPHVVTDRDEQEYIDSTSQALSKEYDINLRACELYIMAITGLFGELFYHQPGNTGHKIASYMDPMVRYDANRLCLKLR